MNLSNEPKAEPIEALFETVGNDPLAWLDRGEALRAASCAVAVKNGHAPQAQTVLDDVWEWALVNDVVRMLRGMALECVIKALWLSTGNDLVAGDRFVDIPGAKHHDLYRMLTRSTSAELSGFSKRELLLLARLSRAIIRGRYPVGRKSRETYPSSPVASGKVQWNKMVPEDEATFESLWGKLISQVATNLGRGELR